MSKPTVALIFSHDFQRQVISPETREQMSAAFDLRSPDQPGKITPEIAAALLKDAEGCMTCWGSPCLDASLLKQAPKLRIAAHSAGSVKGIVSDAFFERGLVVTSAACQIAADVADFTMGLILTSMKNPMELCPAMAEGKWINAHLGPASGLFKGPDDARGCTVGVISASHVGRSLLKLLPVFDIKALLYDPFVSAEKAREMNAEKVELDAIFERSDVVCCHAPSIPETYRLVNATRLAKMKNGAIFINNSRGTLVDEAALVDELKKRRIWAFLDVYDPEPPPPGSPLYGCPNLTMTPHIAGCVGRGRLRLGAQAFSELASFFVGNGVKYPVTQKMLASIG